MSDLEDRAPAIEELCFEAYQAARERFFAKLRADCELRRLEALWAVPAGTIEQVDDPPGSAER
jgi:hypothetical protein